MGNEHLTDHTLTDERQARVEWDALLLRLQGLPPNDGRLDQVRHAIARGEFRVDPRAIAERLIAQFLTS